MRPNYKNLEIDLNKFKVKRKLGHGRNAEVFLVENVDDGRQYALKKIYYGEDDQKLEEILHKLINREISIMARFSHPAIVQFYGYYIDKDQNEANLLLQYAQYGTLKDLIRNAQDQNIDNTTRQKILIGIARAMMYLHKNYIIHRDLKPENILIDSNFNPLISDFGFARSIKDESTRTRRIGSPIYEAPEMLSGKEYNEKIDVYSYGLIMFEIIFNRRPYNELMNVGLHKFTKKVAEDHYRPQFPEFDNNNKNIMEPFKELIESCWSSDPSERPTFESIFNKLTFGSESEDYNNFFDDQNQHKYCIEKVDQEEILNYADSLLTQENRSECMIKQTLADMKQQIDSIKQDSELAINELKMEINAMKCEMKNYIDQHLKKAESPPVSRSPACKRIDLKSQQSIDGILVYLGSKEGGSRSNIHDNKTIKITTNSQHADDVHFFFKEKDFFHPKNIVDYAADSEYRSNDAGGAIVCFDFKDKAVMVSKYQIKSSSNAKCSSHLKNWALEGSKDGLRWEMLDRRSDCADLNGAGNIAVFTVENQSQEFYRYVRIRQTGTSWYGSFNCNEIRICNVEFYGKLQEPQ